MAKIKFQGFGSFGGSLEGRVVSQSKEKGTVMIVVTTSTRSATFHLRQARPGEYRDIVGRSWKTNGKVATSDGLTPQPLLPAPKPVAAAVEMLIDLIMDDADMFDDSVNSAEML